MPANENKIIKKDNAISGCFLEMPDNSLISSVYFQSFFIRNMHAKAPMFITTYIVM